MYVQSAYFNFPNTFNSYLTTQMSTNDKQKRASRVVGKFLLYLFIYNLQYYQIFLPHPSKRNQLGIRLCSCQPQKPAFLVNTSQTKLSCFPFLHKRFLELISATNHNQLSKKYCLYHEPEHLEYCTEINEYWLNKNVWPNIVLLEGFEISILFSEHLNKKHSYEMSKFSTAFYRN